MIVIAVYNMKGGVGKTTAAVNLAYLAAASGARTLLWDLDAQAASSFAFRIHPQVRGFGKKSLRQTDTLTEAIKATDHDNLDLLPADFAYRKLDRFLHRLGRPHRDLAEVLEKIGQGYTHVLLDCPPGLSTLSENVFGAADLVLVPTIPTVLSLRTLAQLVAHFRHRAEETEGTKVRAFLSMVDRRKSLHRHISAWAPQHSEFFLSAQVPYASVVEQTSVQRIPLAVAAPRDAATNAFSTLWSDVRTALAKPSAATILERQRPAAFARAIGDLIAKLGEETIPAAAQEAQPALAAFASADSQAHTVRINVADGEAFDALARALSDDAPPSGVTRLSHIFDTDESVLLRNGYLLQLWEEAGRFTVALEMLAGSAEPLMQREETRLAAIDGRWAADILAGNLSPLTVFERRLGSPLAPVVSAVVTAAGKQPLRRVSWRKRLRRHVGRVEVPYKETMVMLHLELDRISSSGNKIEYQIEATAPGSDAHRTESALLQLFCRAGIRWQPPAVQEMLEVSPADASTSPVASISEIQA